MPRVLCTICGLYPTTVSRQLPHTAGKRRSCLPPLALLTNASATNHAELR